jgi:hypothetical protein
MTKKHFIALADAIRRYNESAFPHGTNTVSPLKFSYTQLLCLADFCEDQSPRFNRERWLDYISGKCTANGGRIK